MASRLAHTRAYGALWRRAPRGAPAARVGAATCVAHRPRAAAVAVAAAASTAAAVRRRLRDANGVGWRLGAPRALRRCTAGSAAAAGAGSTEAAGQASPAEPSGDLAHMQRAYRQAVLAYEKGEVPIGAVIVHNDRVVAEAHNATEETGDPTAHAEMLCIKQATQVLGNWRFLREAALYVTLEPCAMCGGAMLQARVGTLVYGAPNNLLGSNGSWVQLFNVESPASQPLINVEERTRPVQAVRAHPFQPRVEIRRDVMGDECRELMKRFFKMRRKQGGRAPAAAPAAAAAAAARDRPPGWAARARRRWEELKRLVDAAAR